MIYISLKREIALLTLQLTLVIKADATLQPVFARAIAIGSLGNSNFPFFSKIKSAGVLTGIGLQLGLAQICCDR